MTKIEKRIPIPSIKSGTQKVKYPWGGMDVGDSFLIKATDKLKMQANIMQSANRYKKDFPHFKIVTRSIKNGVRVWRIA